MPIPSATWQTKPVHVTYRNIATGLLEAGTWTASNTKRVVNDLGGGVYVIFRAGVVASGPLNTVDDGTPSLNFNAPVLDDPDINPEGGEIDLTINFLSGGSETIRFSPSKDWPNRGVDLAGPTPSGTQSAATVGLAVVGLAVVGVA